MPRDGADGRAAGELLLDPVGGISGDMFVAALLDLWPHLETDLAHTLSLCPLIEGVEYALLSHGDGVLAGKRFVVLRHGRRAEEHHDHDGQHGHTDWSTIRAALQASRIDGETMAHAIGIFTRLAEAEARVHGVEPAAVSFHEVGAWDSIADVVAAATLIARAGISRWTVGPVPLGSGRVRGSHGMLPVPAPATALLLDGFATIDDGIAGERVTPTGAAILSYLCDPTDDARPVRRLRGSGFGFGTRRLPGLSNGLRVLSFERVGAPFMRDSVAVLECEIDDQTGEDLAQALDTLRALDGVHDVVQAPMFGKKGRVSIHIRILADPAARDRVVAALFDETTTIGVRHALTERSVLPRRSDHVHAGGRDLRIKVVERPSGRTVKLEADDLAPVSGHGARAALRRRAEAIRDKEDEP